MRRKVKAINNTSTVNEINNGNRQALTHLKRTLRNPYMGSF